MISFISESAARKYKSRIALVRIDLNIDPRGNMLRVDAVLPTIRLLLKHGLKVVILGHRGRPSVLPESKLKGVKSDWHAFPENRQLSLKPFAAILAGKIGKAVRFVPYEHSWLIHPKEFVMEEKEKVFLLENMRFYRGEEANDRRFGQFLADWGDCYVNDAFAVSHRENASVSAITEFLPSFGGLQLEKEIAHLSGVMKNPTHPFVIVIGGAKTADKLPLMERFWKKADSFLMGGGPANTLLAAQGIPMHDSLHDKRLVRIMRPYAFSEKVVTPVDAVADGSKVSDIGAMSAREYAAIIRDARTIVWSGPLGLFEKKKFSHGTRAVWKAVLANERAERIVGGGETVTSLGLMGKTERQRTLFLSTGGGAMLEYLSGKRLPGIEALR